MSADVTAAGSGLPAPDPHPTPETEPYWTAAAAGRLLISRCPACDATTWYPRTVCPTCHHDGTEPVEASGRGHVHSHTVTRRGMGAYRDAGPYVLAYVELDEGPRVLTNVVGVDPETVEVGQAVRVVFDPTPGGWALPRFTPVEPTP